MKMFHFIFPARKDVALFLEKCKLSVPHNWMTVRTKVMNERAKWYRLLKGQQSELLEMASPIETAIELLQTAVGQEAKVTD